MSVQLIIYPQSYDGVYNSTSYPLTIQYLVNGGAFTDLNSTSLWSYNGVQTDVQQQAVINQPAIIPNTWYRYHTSGGSYYYNITQPQVVSGNAYFSGAYVTDPNHSGIYQKLSNLTVGVNYTVTVDFGSSDDGAFYFKMYDDTGFEFKSQLWSPSAGIMTENFTYTGGGATISFDWNGSALGKSCTVDSIKIVDTLNPQNLVFTDVADGQVICDLYEDEDIPLTLSVDDFKNVAEKVQSYSKAFNLPATKRNNKIFDSIFEITRTDTGLNFNPYKKTQCVLKQDGFLLFEGYLRLIDISDKEGEISYNVNLYSEVVALADTLKDKTFSVLDFTELEHDYNKSNIKWSWNDTGSSITYSNPDTSGFRDDYTTLRYPFVDWSHQIAVGGSNTNNATVGNPELLTLEAAFRPFINIKYLIDRIFDATDFTYESEFFDTEDFKKLYMDFNWGADNTPVVIGLTTYHLFWTMLDDFPPTSVYAGTSFTNLDLRQWTIGGIVVGQVPPNYNLSTNIITATADGENYAISGFYNIQNTSATDTIDVECQWIHNTTVVATQTLTMLPSSTALFNFTFSATLMNGDTLQAQFKRVDPASANTIRMNEQTSNSLSEVTFNVNTEAMTSATILQTLRGEVGQWDFLKGLMTMFNLVSIPDKDNPNNILLEPYADVFIHNTASGTTSDLSLASRSIAHDWTDKIDISQIKLTPLTDLKKKTIFKFVEDDDDYSFNNYKRLVGGHLYGSKLQDEIFYTVLTGEDEIIAEPFAATVVKPLMSQFPQFITPAIYARGNDDTWEGFGNSPRIMYNNGVKSTGASYYIPEQNGYASENQTDFLQFSHLTDIPTISGSRDFHFGICQLIIGVGSPVPDNLFSLYWQPYYNELYNPDTRIMTLKVNLSPADINTFNFFDTVMIKNREFRVNKIDYKPNDLATVEFILVP